MPVLSNPTVSDVKSSVESSRVLIDELFSRVFPVREVDGKLHRIPSSDAYGEAFSMLVASEEEVSGLVPFAQFRTFHTYGYHLFFKPSVAEVISQVPVEHRESLVAFSTSLEGDTLSEILGGANKDLHVAVTTLYRRA